MGLVLTGRHLASRIMTIRTLPKWCCHLTYDCARNCTTQAQRFAHRFAASCVRKTAFAFCTRPDLTWLTRRDARRAVEGAVLAAERVASHSAFHREREPSRQTPLRISVHTSSKAGTRNVKLAQNQKPLLSGRKFTEKLHECLNRRSGVLGLGVDGVLRGKGDAQGRVDVLQAGSCQGETRARPRRGSTTATATVASSSGAW